MTKAASGDAALYVDRIDGGGSETEEVGFEPTVPRSGTPVFETGPFNHSGTPPDSGGRRTIRATTPEELDE
jgi:hypothetical protein